MIETQFYILNEEQFQECSQCADELDVNIDYYLEEFCQVDYDETYTD